MFDKLRLKLTLVYTGIFSLLVVMIVIGSVIIIGHSVLTHEKEQLRSVILAEGIHYVQNGDLPIDDLLTIDDETLAYMVSEPDGKVIHDQISKSGIAKQLFELEDKWPNHDKKVRALFFEDENGKYRLHLVGRDAIKKDGEKIATLYVFEDLSGYYYEERGELAWILVMTLFFIAAGAILGYYLAGRSIKPIQEMFKRQREFVADASHELRTPLTVMGIAAEGIEQDEDSRLSDFSLDTIKIMRSEIKRVEKLVSSLLYLARSDSKVLELDKKPVVIADIVEQTTKLMAPIASGKGLKLIESLTGAPAVVAGDKERLEQLLIILVDNAIKYSESGDVKILVENNFQRVIITVEDEGIGITSNEAKKVFDRFYRVDKSRTRSEGGFGLGLALAKTIVDQHQGTIKAEPAAKKGSRFIVQLPLM